MLSHKQFRIKIFVEDFRIYFGLYTPSNPENFQRTCKNLYLFKTEIFYFILFSNFFRGFCLFFDIRLLLFYSPQGISVL